MFACSLVADKANFSSGLSKCEQSKSILKVMTLVMPWLRDIFYLKPKPIAISVLLCKLRSFNNSENLPFFKKNIILHVFKLCKVEGHAWPYPPCINCLLIYKIPYPSHRFDAKLLESVNSVSYTDHITST